MLGTIVDKKYRLDRLLGRGGMGAVYAATDVRTGEVVAIKMIETTIAVRATDIVARFEREARAAGSIDTEHIARCFGAGTDPATGQPYMVLEYLAGEDLHRVLRRTGAIDPDVALRITAQACLGLVRAHDASVVHRDIKPANLFLARRGPADPAPGEDPERVLKILDFGIAKVLKGAAIEGSLADGLTRTGSMLGSPMYMSPEQARSVKTVDRRADIWSLGVVLYKSLAGRTPFDHVTALGDMILALWSEPPPPIQQFAPWVSRDIAAIVDRMLQVEPSERFQGAGEVLEALAPLLPRGTTIRDSMLVSVSKEAREHGAPMYFRHLDTKSRPLTAKMDATRRLSPTPDVRSGGGTSSFPPAASDTGPRPFMPTLRSGAPGPDTQTDLATTGAVPARPKRLALKAGVLAAVGLTLSLVVASLFVSRGRPAPAVQEPSLDAEHASTSLVVPPATPLVVAPPAVTPPAVTTAPAVTAPPSAEPTAPKAHAGPPAGLSKGRVGLPVPRARPPAPPPAATAAPAAPPTATSTFTDFGDRK